MFTWLIIFLYIVSYAVVSHNCEKGNFDEWWTDFNWKRMV